VGGVVLVPGAVCTVPGAHAPTGTQSASFGPPVYVPAAQGAQTRSVVADGVLVTKVPASQVAHVTHAAAFVVVLKLPLAQPAHVRSVVALPAAASRCPATQLVCDTQYVDGLPSSSQLPAAHGAAGAVPPAQ
jgi:hypothetical protein